MTDDSVNVYGYRLLTSGFLIDRVKKNPIGYVMHNRDGGVVLRWEDFRVEGDKVFAKPVINLAHPRGEQTADEVENGFLNAASVGRIVALEASDSPDLMLEGQTGVTVTKWYCKEISLVDVPGNDNALAELYDDQDNLLNLADLSDLLIPKSDNMSKLLVAAPVLAALNLSDKSSQEEFDNAIADLADRAAKADKAIADLADMTAVNTQLKTQNDQLLADQKAAKVASLIDKGKADKKLTEKLATTLADQYKDNPEGLEAVLADMTPVVSVTEQIKEGGDLGDYAGQTWDDLYRADKLEEVRQKHPDLYEKLKNEKFK